MDIPVSKVRKVSRSRRSRSRSKRRSARRKTHLGDFIEDRQVVSLAEAVINLNLKEQTESVLEDADAA
jgi:RNA polymerase primary sigma factor